MGVVSGYIADMACFPHVLSKNDNGPGIVWELDYLRVRLHRYFEEAVEHAIALGADSPRTTENRKKFFDYDINFAVLTLKPVDCARHLAFQTRWDFFPLTGNINEDPNSANPKWRPGY